jgi:RHS repeat-associated protein
MVGEGRRRSGVARRWWIYGIAAEGNTTISTVGLSPLGPSLADRPVRRPRPLAVLVLGCLLLGVLLAQSMAGGRSFRQIGVRPGEVSQTWLSNLPLAAHGPISAALGSQSAAFRATPAGSGFDALSPVQHLRVHFGRSGITIGSSGLLVGLSLRAVGDGSSLTAVSSVQPSTRGNRVVYTHPGFSEWYANGPHGLEQGFTIPRRLSGLSSGPLTISMVLSGDAHASLSRGGQSVTLSHDGGPSLLYDGLMASDAQGRLLHSWFALSHGRVLLRIDADGARFPLRIDPLVHQAKLTGSGESGAHFGHSVALSANGNTAVIGSPGSDEDTGAVRVFTRSGTTWTEQTKITGTSKSESFGYAVALSANGNTAIVGGGGAAYVFTRSEGKWTQQAKFTVEEGTVDTVALSGDGNTAMVGDPGEAENTGAVWVFTRSEGKWEQQGAKFTGTGEELGVHHEVSFGDSIALSNEGNTALVGGERNDEGVGAAWVFTRSEGKWSQQGPKLAGKEEIDSSFVRFGDSVALSSNGNTALIGGYGDNKEVGAAWVFTRSEGGWTQQGSKLKASGEEGSTEFPDEGWFGWSVALSAEGNTALIGGIAEEWAYGYTSGAAVVFARSGSTWTQQGAKITSGEPGASGNFGDSVALSSSGNTGLVGAEDISSNSGAAYTFTPGFSPEELYGLENEAEPDQHRPCGGDPVNCATGNLVESQTDLRVGGRGPGLHLTRTYNSQLAATQSKPGPFGYGWTGPYSAHLTINEEAETATVSQNNASTAKFVMTEGKTYVGAGSWVQATLVKEGSTYVYTLPDQTKMDFNSSGKLISETDRNGNAITMSYNTEGELESVKDGDGRKLTFAYNGEGFVESAKDPLGHTVKYTYASGNLTSVTQPGEASLRWQFEYNSEHEMTEKTDGRGHTVTTKYNSAHQATSQTDAMGRKHKWEYSTTEWGYPKTTIEEPNGSTTVEWFNNAMLPVVVTRASGTSYATSTTYEYNEAYEVISLTDPDGHTTTYGYDAAGDRTSEKNANGNETKWAYDSTHDINTIITPKGETTTIKRNADGDPEVIERPAPGKTTQKTTYKYDSYGDLTSEINPLEQTRTYEYDAAGDRIAEIDPAGNKRTWGYNEDSQLTSMVSPRGNVKGAEASKYETKIELNPQGREIRVTDPLGHETKYTYDGNGNLETMTNGNGHKTTYTYNADNELTAVKEPSGAITETEYDGAGQVIDQIDGNKHATKYVRNLLERVTEEVDPLGHKTTKEYDLTGNLKKLTDPKGRTTTYTYNPGNELTEVTYSDGKTHSVKYEYDKDGDRTKMIDGTGTTKYTYDELDRLTETETGNKEKAKYEYNLANEPTKITYPNGKAVTRAYDKDGRLEKVTDWLTHATTFTYNPDSDLEKTVFPSETKDEDKYTYNDADQQTEVQMAKSTETLASLSYTRDNNGQIKETVTKGLPGEEKNENTYDENSRLTKSGSVAYEYDAANNPTKEGSSTNTYNEADELEKATGITYSYDEFGERTKASPEKGPVTTYGYNEAGNLITIERPKEGETAKIEDSYAYNGEGQRTSQTISGTTSYLTWDMAEELPLILSDGTNSYIYGPGGLPIEQVSSGGTVTYLHHDQQGSTRLLTGSTGTVTGKCTYGAFGTPTCEGASTTPLGYDAQYTNSDTGLIYMRARNYDPSTAQFVTRDPWVTLTGEPYSYVTDNPLTWADPTGRCGLWCVTGIVAGGVALATGVGEVVAGGTIVAEGTLGAISAVSGAVGAGAVLKECVGGSDISCVGAGVGAVASVGAGAVALGVVSGTTAAGTTAIGVTASSIGSLGDAAGALASPAGAPVAPNGTSGPTASECE